MSRETHPVATSRSSLVGGWLTAVVFFGLAGTVWLATRSSGTLLDLFEQGHWLGPASDMLAGKVPYRETFPMHGFLSDGGRDYLLFRLFEPTYRLSTDVRHFLNCFFHPAIFLVAAGSGCPPKRSATSGR